MDLWQKRGETFGKRSTLLQRAEALQGIVHETLRFLEGLEGPILDVGCGDGIPTAMLVSHFPLIGVDFALSMLNRARAKLTSADLLRATIDHLPLQSNIVPAVTCYFVLSDYADREALLAEMQRVLLPGGKLVVADYSSEDDFNNILDELQKKVLGKDRYMFRLDPGSLSREVEQAGFEVGTFRELHYTLRIQLDTFISQLYLSSVGAQYREKQLTHSQWRRLLEDKLEGPDIVVTRRFALVLATKTG
jgi:SAM-dependent methyltransferase